jgi:membrane protein
MLYTNKHMKKYKSNLTQLLPIYLIIQTYKNWRNDRTLRLGAGLAYYGVFATVPILTLMLGVAAYFFSTQDIISYVQEFLSRIFGSETSSSLSQLVNRLGEKSVEDSLSFSSLLSFVILLVTGSFIFVAFQDALDTIWHNPIRLGLKKWLKRYLWAYIVVIITSSLLFSVLLINTLGKLATSALPGQFVRLESLTNVIVYFSSWAFGIAILTVIYRLMIYQKISWVILVVCSTVTSILIVVGTWLLSFYLSNYAVSSVSAVVGAVLLLLIWIYYEAQIILIGAQLIKTVDNNKKRLPTSIRKHIKV